VTKESGGTQSDAEAVNEVLGKHHPPALHGGDERIRLANLIAKLGLRHCDTHPRIPHPSAAFPFIDYCHGAYR
jgi:hypothetical protein